MYIIPKIYRCPDCTAVYLWGPNDYHPAPVIDGEPVCPDCWAEFIEFIRESLPIMKRES